MVFELTNEQRKCFALVPVNDMWQRIELKPGPHHDFLTILYVAEDRIVKCILVSDHQYSEYELSEAISKDGKFLLPKSENGKGVPLTASNILKRKGIGMCLSYRKSCIRLWSDKSCCDYYSNVFFRDRAKDLGEFALWVDAWCQESTDADIVDVLRFSQMERKRNHYKEGDVFRFKIGRRYYGYGRILLDYGRMRKNGEPFWDILMGKPLVCSVYHLVTDRCDVSVEQLCHLQSLPSWIIADDLLFTGEYEVIGNIPIGEHEDYPIMYGNSVDLDSGEKVVCFQHGRVFKKIENASALYSGFTNNSVSLSLNFKLDMLLRCSEEKSNEPYWESHYAGSLNADLRNPKHVNKRNEILEQFGLQQNMLK